jgi:hypothetical protein
MRHFSKTVLIAGAMLTLSLGALAAPALASASGAGAPATTPQQMMGGGTGGTLPMGGMWNGNGPWGGTGMWGMGSGMKWLRDNPAAMQDWLKMHSQHLAAMHDWYDTYKADLTSPAAQQALHDVWQTFWDDMQSFYAQYGGNATWTCPVSGMWSGWQMGGMMGGGSWDTSHMWGTGYGAGWMMANPTGMGQWLDLRGRQTADAMAWMRKHHGALRSAGATKALNHMTSRHRAQVKGFFMQHQLPTSAAMMRSGAGGWMGLGGMWGGWGW